MIVLRSCCYPLTNWPGSCRRRKNHTPTTCTVKVKVTRSRIQSLPFKTEKGASNYCFAKSSLWLIL